MKLKQKEAIIILILLVILYIVIFLFQNVSPQPEITKIYFADRFTDAHKELVEKYNKLHKGEVEVIPIDFPNFDFSTNERKEVLARSLRGTGDGIDLFAVDLIWVQRFAKWCEPLQYDFSKDELNRLLPKTVESCYFNGELVAVPLARGPSVMYYREDLLKKYKDSGRIIRMLNKGITWPQFINLKKELNYTNPFYIFTGADYEGLICCFIELILDQNPNYFARHGFNLETIEARKALQLMVDLINKYDLSPQIVTDFTEVPSYEYYIKNDGLFIHGWPSYDKDFREHPFDPKKEGNLKKTTPPFFSGGRPTTIMGGWNLMISKFSHKKKEVIDFVKFLLSDSSQEIFYKESGYWPVIKKFYDDSSYTKKYPEIPDMKRILKTSQNRPADEDYTKFSKIMSMYIEQALKNKISINEALTKATDAIEVERVMVKDFDKLSN